MANHQGLLTDTGQQWKLRIMTFGIVLGAPLIFFAIWHQDTMPGSEYIRMVLAGTLISAFSLVFPVLAIRCPRCGSHWLWIAYRKPHRKWYDWLKTLTNWPHVPISRPTHDIATHQSLSCVREISHR